MLKQLVILQKLRKSFSKLDALILWFGLMFGKHTFKLPQKKVTITLRKDTKDLETFEEIFFSSLYFLHLPIIPKTIVDGGANVGLASLFFSFRYPDAAITAIEIEKFNVEILKKNTSSIANFSVENKALYSTKSFFKIEDPYNATNSFVVKEVDASEPYDIESVTLNEILEKNNWETIDLLKIDIEGAEKDLFEKNYENWLPKTKIIMIETHDRMVPKCSYDVMSTINKYNFILYTTTEGTLIYYNMDLVSI